MKCDNTKKFQLCGTANIGSKGQIVIPKHARDALWLKSWDSVSIVLHDNVAIGIVPNSSLEQLMKYVQEQDPIEFNNNN